MCDKVEAVLKEATTINCTVVMDGEENTSDDFICIMCKENGDTSLYYNTDAITLGMGMKMIARAFVESMARLTEEEREAVSSVLGNDFNPDVEVAQ